MRRVLVGALLATMACDSHAPRTIPVGSVAVTASSATLVVGATTQLAAEVIGADGNAIPGATVAWSTTTPTIISVSASGFVTALQAGQGTARATSGGKFGDFVISVKNPPIASLAFDRDSAILTLPAGTTTLAPIAKDAGGHAISNPTVFFASDAPKVASVTQLGVVTAVAAGVAVITASAEGVTGSTRIRVTANSTGTSPRITTVTPLVAGASATITGANFAPTPGGNAVLVEGIATTVTAASTTQLTVTLPATGWACSAERPVTVQVNANNEIGVGTASLRTAIARSLAVGQSLVLSGASDARCNELSNTGGSYFVSVYNVARTMTGGDASFTLRGAASTPPTGLANSGRTVAGAAAVAVDRTVAPAAMPVYPPIGSAAFARWQQLETLRRADAVHASIVERSLEFLRSHPMASRQRASVEGAAPSAGPLAHQVTTLGAITPLKVVNLDGQGSLCASFISIGARTAWIGQHVVIVEDTLTALGGVATLRGQLDTLYAAMGQEFDTVMWPILTQDFGNPMAMDQQLSRTGKVVMVVTPRINVMAGGSVAGFVASCDFSPVLSAPSSNLGEYFYSVMPTALSTGTGAITRDSWMRTMRATMIHEVKHITSYAEHLARNLTGEEVWLEEGTARHAEEQYARAIYGVPWKGNTGYQASVFCDLRPASASAPQCAGRPILMLRHFDELYVYLQNPDPYTMLGRTGFGYDPFYGVAWSMVRWAIDHYATAEAAFLTQMVQSSQTGIANIEARTGRPWEEMLGEWTLALFTDDYPGVTFANAHLRFPTWNIRDEFNGLCGDLGPCVNPANVSSLYPVAYPLAPRNRTFGAFSDAVTFLSAGSFSSWLLSGAQSAPQVLELKGALGGDPPAQLRIAIVRVQ